ncbi:hypothetical protein F5884DRAFT_777755 [Xylogone sp. PMI_703]|nr:hypothetical protein F5884DRAFT_777755 [Xylogone sp. PMI_703]
MIALFDPLTAPQLVQSPLDPDRWENVAQPVIGYRMRIDRPHVSNNELDLVVLEFQIIEVGGRFVEGMSKFDIRLLETPSEKLMIGDIRYSLPVPEHSMPGKEGKQCHSRLCRWKEIVAGKLPKAKGCGRKSGRPHHLHNGEHSSHRNHGHHRPQGHRGHHGYYERHQTFVRFVKGIALHVLIPIAIGIVVGMTASMVGFVAATFIVFLWRLLFRRNRAAAYAQVPQEETTTEESEKSKIVFQEEEHIDAPPVYEEAVELKA